jgi:hypothetical protein
VTYARDHLFERAAVQDRRAIFETALNRGMGETTYAQVRQEFERRAQAGEFRQVDHPGAKPQYTAAAMVGMEREIVALMREGNQRGYSDPMLAEFLARLGTLDRHPELNAGQRQAAEEVFLSREKIVGLDGVAGAGKQRRWPLSAKARRRRDTGSKVSRPRPARRRNWPKPVSRLRHCKNIWRAARGRIPESGVFMCSTNPPSRPPSRSTSL